MKNSKSDGGTDRVYDNAVMTSSRLQDDFVWVYREFFHLHDMVLSVPSILTWWADISHGVSILRLKQKLPLKNFSWIRFNTSWRVTFRSIYVYSILENTFHEARIDSIFSTTDHLSIYLERYLIDHWYTNPGIEIDFLAEAPPWHGFAFSAGVSVLLAYIVSLISGDILPSHRTEYGELELDWELFERVFDLSQSISCILSASWAIGSASNYTIMQRGVSSPIIYIWTPYDTATHTVYHKGVLSDFFGISEQGRDSIPLDYGVIYTWLPYRFTDLLSKRAWDKIRESWLDDFVQKLIEHIWLSEGDSHTLRNLLVSDLPWGYPTENMNLRILEWFSFLIWKKDEDGAIERFFERIQSVWLESFSHQPPNSFFFALEYYFERLRLFDNEQIGIIPFNTGSLWGSLLFTLQEWKSRDTLKKAIKHLQDEWHVASLIYASWRDGISNDGVRLEQYISRSIYSAYTRIGDVIFRDSHGNSYCDNYESIIERESGCILLDTLSSRIYIGWKKLTSKDLHSQYSTIDVLKILMKNMWQEVSNTQLPLSTYSQNKTELLTKIVRPIKLLIQEYSGQEPSIYCSWGIGSYYLRLEKDDDIRIGIIEVI